MFKFFRKIRFNLIKTNKALEYIKYALGEILLVVIGILLAVQINNWNQEKENQKKITSIFIDILNDLADDIHEVERIIQFYEKKDSITNRVLSNKVTVADYEGPNPYLTLVLNRRMLKINSNGYENLVLHFDKIPEDQKKVMRSLKRLYNRDKLRVLEFQEKTSEIIDKTLEHYALNYDWFSNSEEKHLEEMRDYQLYDPKYKNEVKLYQIITVRNLLGILNQFRRDAVEVYKMLHDIVNPGDPLPEFIPEAL